jgi:hypothetical protein
LSPTGRAAVWKVATPPESVPSPNGVDPFTKWTVPVGVPVPGLTAATVAVKVTTWPRMGEAGEELTETVVVAELTVSGVAGEVLVP